MNSLIRLAVVSIVVTATELTIQWNSLAGVDDVSTAGQTTPLIIGIAAIVRVLYVAFFKAEDDDSNIETPSPEMPRPQPTERVPVMLKGRARKESASRPQPQRIHRVPLAK